MSTSGTKADIASERAMTLVKRVFSYLLRGIKGWLTCCTNSPVYAWLIITFLFVLILFSLESPISYFLLPFTLIIISLLIGILVAARILTYLLRNADKALDELPDRSIRLVKGGETGLNPFDTLLTAHKKRITSLLELLEEKNSENMLLLERYDLLTENLAAAVIIRDQDGKITYCSPYIEVLTGYALQEIYEYSDDFLSHILHQEDHQIYQRALKITEAGEAFQYRYRFFHKSGIEMWAETRTVPILDAQGNLLSSLSITLDITGTVRYQRQIEEKNKDLQDFTYMVSHDLKAPIFTIKGMLNIIEEDFSGSLDRELAEPIAHICRATEKLESLVSSVLEYSKLSSLQSNNEGVDLNEVMQEIKDDFKTQLDDIQGSIEIDQSLPSVCGNHLRVYQVFSNLVSNAMKYRSPERALQLSIHQQASPRPSAVTLLVSDNGVGIPLEKQEMIFRPFQRAHGADIEGSGIGLACVKKIVEQYGGSIEVHSTSGSGSQFSITLREYDPL